MVQLPLVAVLLGACTGAATGPASASAQAPTPPPSTTGGPIMPAGSWVSTGVTGHALVPGTRVTLTYSNKGQLTVNAGCNTMSATAWPDHGKLVVSQMASTEMGCEADRMAQDAWLATFLQGAAFSVGDGLTLTNGPVTMELALKETKNLPLEGTTWTVTGLLSGDTAASVPPGVTATLAFAGGRVSVDTGCNTGSGSATIADGTIRFGSIALTAKACTTWAGAVERQITSVLAGVQPYAVAGDSLTIGASGQAGLALTGGSAATTPNPEPS
jgi:heat shock protein HslJ